MNFMNIFGKEKKSENPVNTDVVALSRKSNTKILSELQSKFPYLKDLYLTRANNVGDYYKLKAVDDQNIIHFVAVNEDRDIVLDIQLNLDNEVLKITDCVGSVEFDNWLLVEPKVLNNKYLRYCIDNNKIMIGDTMGTIYDSALVDLVTELRKYTGIEYLEERVKQYEEIDKNDSYQIKALTDTLTHLAIYVLDKYLATSGQNVSKISNSDKVKLESEMVAGILTDTIMLSDLIALKSGVTFKMKEILDSSKLLKELLN